MCSERLTDKRTHRVNRISALDDTTRYNTRDMKICQPYRILLLHLFKVSNAKAQSIFYPLKNRHKDLVKWFAMIALECKDDSC